MTIAYGTRTLATLYKIAGLAELSSMSNSIKHHVHPLSQFNQDKEMQNIMESPDDDDTNNNISYWTDSLVSKFDNLDLKDNNATNDWQGDENKVNTFINLLLKTDDDNPPCLDPPPLLKEPIAPPTPSLSKNQAAVIIPLSSNTVFTSQSHIFQQCSADAQQPHIKKVN